MLPCRGYSADLAASVSTDAIFARSSCGRPWRSWRYWGLLYETQTFPSLSSRIRIFKGRSIAMLGAASIRGVPALGLPKISSLVGGIFIPTFSASPLWSTSANRLTPLACNIPLSFATVSSTEWSLGRLMTPLSLICPIDLSLSWECGSPADRDQRADRADPPPDPFSAVVASIVLRRGGLGRSPDFPDASSEIG